MAVLLVVHPTMASLTYDITPTLVHLRYLIPQ